MIAMALRGSNNELCQEHVLRHVNDYYHGPEHYE